MLNQIREKLKILDIDIQAVPIDCLVDLKKDISMVLKNSKVNDYQKDIMENRYILDLPDLAFTAKSIIAATIPMTVVKVEYHYNDVVVDDIFNYLTFDAGQTIIDTFVSFGLNIKSVYWLPQKRLAARCGLGEFGRNNLIHTKEYGSFVNIFAFFSDLVPSEYIWEEAKNKEFCQKCRVCINNCPTGAINEKSFLIDNELCIKRYKYSLSKEESASVSDCFFCQEKCASNLKRLKQVNEVVEFSDYETKLILNKRPEEKLPQSLMDKFAEYGSDWAVDDLPRKIKDKLIMMNEWDEN